MQNEPQLFHRQHRFDNALARQTSDALHRRSYPLALDREGVREKRAKTRWCFPLMNFCAKPLTMISCCALLSSSPLSADEADVFNLTATVSAQWDDNFFRRPPDADPQADTITTTTIGANLDKTIGVQRLIANVNMVDYRYQTNDYLDFVAVNYDAKWLWSAGKRLTGTLSFLRSELPNDYADNRSAGRRNVQTTEVERFEANYWFHSSWAAVAGLVSTSLTNQVPTRTDGDYDANGYELGLRFRPASGNTATARAVHLDGNYSNRLLNSVFQYDNGFTQDNYGVELDWRLTGHSQLRGRLDYLDRQHQHFSQRDYAGWVGNLQYLYAYSGKSVFSVGYNRKLEAYQQLTSSYYVLDQITLAAQWAATSQITVNGRVAYGLQAYRGAIIPLPAGLEQRQDDTSSLGLDVAYTPARWLQLNAGVTLTDRNSNYDAFDYRDRIVFISATAKY